MSCVGVNDIKEEPVWEDYCISEAQAREAALAVKPEPGSEPPGSFAGAPDTNYKTDGSNHSPPNSIKSHNTEQNNYGSVTVKEESGESWMQGFTGLYEETNNTDELKTPMDLHSVKSEKIETDAESEELNKVPPVFEKPKVVNSRQDLMVINDIAQAVNRKRVMVEENISRPVTKYVYTPNQQPVGPAKNNSQFKKPYVLNKVAINPEIGLLSQPSTVANALLESNLVSVSDTVKKQSSNFVSRGYQKIPLLNSVAYNNPAIPRAMGPCPPRRAIESLKQPLPKDIFQPIKVPISQLYGKVSLKPLEKNPPKTTNSLPKLRPVIISKSQSDTILKLRPDTISNLQPGTISKLRPDSISNLQPGTTSKVQHATISKLRPDSISNLQPGISKVQPGTISKLQPDTISNLQPGTTSKLRPDSISKLQPGTILTLKTNVLDLQTGPTRFITIVSNPFENVKPKCYQKVPHGNKIEKTSTTTALKSNITAAPSSKPTPMVPAIFHRITNSKSINSQIPDAVKNSLTPKIINGDKQSATQNNSNIQRIATQMVTYHQNIPSNNNTASEKSDKVVNLEDFLIPSYVVLERMKERTCKDCEKTFYEHKAFIDHTRTSQKWKKIVSNLGNDGGISNDSTNIDSFPPSLTCTYCHKSFSTHYVLYYHVRRKHLCRKRNFHCDYCGKKCLERQHLINHIRTHTGEKPYKCLICKSRHRTASNLASHNINMHGTKKHLCPVCSRPFNMISNMKKHIRTHSGERPYVCEICNRKFVQKHHLYRHMESHLDIRRYKCNTCKMRFLRKAHLDKHKNTHTKKRSLKKSRQKV